VDFMNAIIMRGRPRRQRREQKRALQVLGAGAALAVVAALIETARHPRWLLRSRRLVHHNAVVARDRLAGMRARLHPPAPAGDEVIAERVRARLGHVIGRLGPHRAHVEVAVEGGAATLRGWVATQRDAHRIARAARRVAGVQRVTSQLSANPRTSENASTAQGVPEDSPLWRRLHEALLVAGIEPNRTTRFLRVTLGELAIELPQHPLQHLESHFPADVRELIGTPARRKREKTRTPEQLVHRVAADADVPGPAARAGVLAVMATLQEAVPEEARDVAAVLPQDIRVMWESAPPLALPG
jgi:uncharacterized protein (DUF2267 family)